MGEYLIGANGAHGRYRPNDWKAVDCRKAMLVTLSPLFLRYVSIGFFTFLTIIARQFIRHRPESVQGRGVKVKVKA